MDKAAVLARVRAKYVSLIEEAELAVRLIEAICEIKRPVGKLAILVMDDLPAEERDAYRRGARVAVEYFRECIANANTTS